MILSDFICPACKNHRGSKEHQRQKDKCAAKLCKEAAQLEALNGTPKKQKLKIIPFGFLQSKNGQIKTTEFL